MTCHVHPSTCTQLPGPARLGGVGRGPGIWEHGGYRRVTGGYLSKMARRGPEGGAEGRPIAGECSLCGHFCDDVRLPSVPSEDCPAASCVTRAAPPRLTIASRLAACSIHARRQVQAAVARTEERRRSKQTDGQKMRSSWCLGAVCVWDTHGLRALRVSRALEAEDGKAGAGVAAALPAKNGRTWWPRASRCLVRACTSCPCIDARALRCGSWS